MSESNKVCPKHNIKLRRKHNSNMYYPCPRCAYEKATEKKEEGMYNWKRGSSGRKKSSKTKAMDKADKYFSRYIRLLHTMPNVQQKDILVCKCYTCGAVKDIMDIDNGHFVNREHKTVRFHEDNARPQCKHCNRFRSGKHNIFEANLIKEIGEDRVAHIKALGLEPGEDNEIFYNEMADKYRLKIKELCKERGISNPFNKA